jgi:hypothetical protein
VQNKHRRINRIKGKDASKKRRKYLPENTSSPHLRLGGLCNEEGENPFKSEQNQQMIQEEVYGSNLSILLSLYPKISAIASGATPIGSAVAHPIEISQQKKRARNFGCIANKTLTTPIGRYS